MKAKIVATAVAGLFAGAEKIKMKTIAHVSILVALCLGAVVLNAQETITMKLGTKNCGPSGPASPYCWGIPVTANDRTTGSIWIDYNYQGHGFISFLGNYKGLNGQSWANVTAVNPDGSVDFSGTDSEGRNYTGAMSFTYYTYIACARGCRSILVITGGNLVVVYE